MLFGVARSSFGNSWGYVITGTRSIYFDQGTSYPGGASCLSAFGVGDILQVAVDYENNLVWFGRNGTWGSNCGDPGNGGAGLSLTGTGDIDFMWLSGNSQTGTGICSSFNFKNPTYSIPTGFSKV
jgi:hypothetical protein